jgi:ESS family glutamate:Na+ symporter
LFELDLIHTLAFGGVALLTGYGLRRWVPILGRYNLPAPVLGGLLVAVIVAMAREHGVSLFRFDTTLQSPLMIAFFTTIGFQASLSLLRVGGPQVLRFFAIASVFAVVQNLIGMLIALPFGLDPLFGVLVGSVTLAGGPATGLAFAPLFEHAGVTGAASIAIAAAMGGIVAGGLVGGPLATFLVHRYRLAAGAKTAAMNASTPNASSQRRAGPTDPKPETQAADCPESELVPAAAQAAAEDDGDTFVLLKNLIVILVAMWIGAWVSRGFAAFGLTLPAYIGAMLVAAAFRNLDDLTGWLRLSHPFMDRFGAVALSLFLVLALMTLKLWELAGLALPLITIIAVQVLLALLVAAGPVFRLMGRNYESAVMSGGFLGFMLGTTANAMAVMHTLVERYGPAPRAFLVAPMVGAFFIDFTNALIITAFVNVLA